MYKTEKKEATMQHLAKMIEQASTEQKKELMLFMSGYLLATEQQKGQTQKGA